MTFTDAYGFDGRTVVDREGKKIGAIHEVFADSEGGQPEWAGAARASGLTRTPSR